MDRCKVYRIVEFISSCMNFPYDSDDAIESLSSILSSYGIYDVLTDDEYYLPMDELLELAEKSQVREAERWADMQLKCGKDSTPVVVEYFWLCEWFADEL